MRRFAQNVRKNEQLYKQHSIIIASCNFCNLANVFLLVYSKYRKKGKEVRQHSPAPGRVGCSFFFSRPSLAGLRISSTNLTPTGIPRPSGSPFYQIRVCNRLKARSSHSPTSHARAASCNFSVTFGNKHLLPNCLPTAAGEGRL